MYKKISGQIRKILFLSNACIQQPAELILRVLLASFILTHGWSKLSSFAEKMDTFPDPLGLGSQMSLILVVYAEFFCSLLLIFGLLTRLAAFSILATMLVAAFVFHSDDPFSARELPLLYGIGFLYFTLAGGNRYSLDEKIRGKCPHHKKQAT